MVFQDCNHFIRSEHPEAVHSAIDRLHKRKRNFNVGFKPHAEINFDRTFV
jgi:hypothetical protein